MRKKIGKLLMILGIGVLLVPIIGTIYTYYEGKKLYEDHLQNLQQLNTSQGPIENRSAPKAEDKIVLQEVIPVEDEEAEDVEEEIKKTKEGIDVIGRIKIPIIKADLLIVEGVSKKALELGGGHMKGTALPGEVGNCAIAGHRNYTFGQIFNRLNEVKLEDEIILEVGEESYTYTVKDIKLVKPEDVSILKQPTDKKEVTLITCHPVYRATHRLVVTGELVD